MAATKEEKELKKQQKLELEKLRIEAMCEFEKSYPDLEFICGIDEAGRGPLAGPVVAGAVVLPKNHRILYVNDSKKISEKKRNELFDIINKEAVSVGVGIVDEKCIDEIENKIFNMEVKEVGSKCIGEIVMDQLKDLDQVAYVRFASVYREFKDVNTFMSELKKLLDTNQQ